LNNLGIGLFVFFDQWFFQAIRGRQTTNFCDIFPCIEAHRKPQEQSRSQFSRETTKQQATQKDSNKLQQLDGRFQK